MSIEIGSKVRIVRRVENDVSWNTSGQMDWTLNEVGIVEHVRSNLSCRVCFKNGESWLYQKECLDEIGYGQMSLFGIDEG